MYCFALNHTLKVGALTVCGIHKYKILRERNKNNNHIHTQMSMLGSGVVINLVTTSLKQQKKQNKCTVSLF